MTGVITSEKKLAKILSGYKGSEGELISILQKAQSEFGYLQQEVMLEVAKFIRVPPSRVYAVATFYAQFRFTPIGRTHIVVCRGTACHVKGAKRILEQIEKLLGITQGQTSSDGKYSLEAVACIGACGLSPCIVINKKVAARVTLKRLTELFSKSKPR